MAASGKTEASAVTDIEGVYAKSATQATRAVSRRTDIRIVKRDHGSYRHPRPSVKNRDALQQAGADISSQAAPTGPRNTGTRHLSLLAHIHHHGFGDDRLLKTRGDGAQRAEPNWHCTFWLCSPRLEAGSRSADEKLDAIELLQRRHNAYLQALVLRQRDEWAVADAVSITTAIYGGFNTAMKKAVPTWR